MNGIVPQHEAHERRDEVLSVWLRACSSPRTTCHVDFPWLFVKYPRPVQAISMSQYLKALPDTQDILFPFWTPSPQSRRKEIEIKSFLGGWGVRQRVCHTFLESYMSCMQYVQEVILNIGTDQRKSVWSSQSSEKVGRNDFYEWLEALVIDAIVKITWMPGDWQCRWPWENHLCVSLQFSEFKRSKRNKTKQNQAKTYLQTWFSLTCFHTLP